MAIIKSRGYFSLLIFLLLLLLLATEETLATQEHLYELIEGNPPITVLKEGPIVRVVKPRSEPLPEPTVLNVPKRKVALTFDDGPDLRYTPQLLDILQTEQVLATFFILGERAEWYPGMIQRIFSEGHLLANHSRTHPDFAEMTNEEIVQQELVPTSRVVERITGYFPRIIRPPYGSLRTDSVHYLNGEGWQIIRWSLDTFDWDQTRNQPQQIINRILEQHHDNAIVLMHCNNKVTVEVLPKVIQTLRQLGYEFVTVDALN